MDGWWVGGRSTRCVCNSLFLPRVTFRHNWYAHLRLTYPYNVHDNV